MAAILGLSQCVRAHRFLGALPAQIAALRGVGQSLARLCEILFGRNVNPVSLNLFARVLMLLAFTTGLLNGVSTRAAAAFAFLVGAGNGLLTVAWGPLMRPQAW